MIFTGDDFAGNGFCADMKIITVPAFVRDEFHGIFHPCRDHSFYFILGVATCQVTCLASRGAAAKNSIS